ncbi:MAG: polynucleotide adenylyltransferase, partial [Helicobacter sp.]|nr:polynucleotide adenylyltransferase [Helicobacter sp.]
MKIHIPSFVQNALQILREAGFEGYAVGGCVRDSMLNITPKDWDIATNAMPDEITHVFAGRVQTIFQKNRRFGTISILFASNASVEITTYRSESDYADCRHPNS